jgi:hypothetical protein
MARTKLLCIQAQPARAKSLDLEAVAAFLGSRVMSAGVRELFIERGRSDAWINFNFRSISVDRTWDVVQPAFQHRRWGAALRRSTIVICQGSRGWDDYRLLHHFDGKQALDRLPVSMRNAR